jgi:hypothetical protein
MSNFPHLGAACRAFQDYPGAWFFCGGTALDLFCGQPLRTRHDIDIGLLRDEQDFLRAHFPGIELSYVENSSKRLWREERIELPVHELYLHLPGEHLELLLNEAADGKWIYRRDARVTRDMQDAILTAPPGIPYLAPEIVLLYKSKHLRDRDIFDFNAVIARLSTAQRGWLKDALQTCYLGGHPWSESLAA